MAELLSVAEALRRVLAKASPLPATPVPLNAAHGLVLVDHLAALRTQPPAANSSMDGYAVRATDVTQAPVTLDVIGESAAGHPYDGTIQPGQAARIFTGGIMPAGADTVVIQEHTKRDGNKVVVKKATAKARNVRDVGIDFSKGDSLLAEGRRLTGRDLMLAAAMNYPELMVHRRPKIAVLGTGDELVPPGASAASGQIVYSNGFALLALARSEGAEAIDLGVVGDRVEDIVTAIRKGRDAGADVLVTTGGASVGDHDLVQKALAAEGLALSFWKIALRPGRPTMHGRLGGMQVLGLPGNPVSSYVCALLFMVPLIRTLMGRSDIEHTLSEAILGCDMPQNDERQDYLRATLMDSRNGPIATPLPHQDSSLMAPLAKADCLLIRPPHAPAATAGSRCVILKFGL